VCIIRFKSAWLKGFLVDIRRSKEQAFWGSLKAGNEIFMLAQFLQLTVLQKQAIKQCKWIVMNALDRKPQQLLQYVTCHSQLPYFCSFCPTLQLLRNCSVKQKSTHSFMKINVTRVFHPITVLEENQMSVPHKKKR